jgi:hypothetical protein
MIMAEGARFDEDIRPNGRGNAECFEVVADNAEGVLCSG